MKTKQNKWIVMIIMGLAVVLVITGRLNRDVAATKAKLNEEAVFIVMESGQEAASWHMGEIQAMGESDFEANLKTNGKDPIPYSYTGVLLKTIIEESGLDLSDAKGVVVTAADGYAVTVTMEKLMADDNVYLAYMREGQLIGTREEGGKGPYQMIISKDKFSQYWCKYALSVDVQK